MGREVLKLKIPEHFADRRAFLVWFLLCVLPLLANCASSSNEKSAGFFDSFGDSIIDSLDDSSKRQEIKSGTDYYQNKSSNRIRDPKEAESASRYDYLMRHNEFGPN